MPMKTNCDRCGIEVDRFKNLKKVNGEYICKECYRENRKKHRDETIEEAGIRKELQQLKNKAYPEKRRKYQREYYHRVRKVKTNKQDENLIPKIKGAKRGKEKNPNRSYSYLSFDDKQNLFRILINRGIDPDKAKERIHDLIQEQIKVREKMKKKNKSEEQIKIKQQEMLEELWQG